MSRLSFIAGRPMPIVDVRAVVSSAQPLQAGAAAALASTLGNALGAPPGRVWVRLHRIDESDYAENDTRVEKHQLPVFVCVLHAHPPEGSGRSQEAAVLTKAVAAALGRQEDRVHVEYACPGAGRVAFGGRLVD